MLERIRIPRPAAKRLILYLREIGLRAQSGVETISSRQLGEALGVTDAQVRKDLTHVGQFGQPGVGYSTVDLHQKLRRAMGTDQAWAAVLVGAGNIGRALGSYGRFAELGFRIVGVFDSSPAMQGKVVAGNTVAPMARLSEVVAAEGARIGIIAVPRESAQAVADALTGAGIQGILNFAPCRVTVPPAVRVTSVDLTVALEQLAFELRMLDGEDEGEA